MNFREIYEQELRNSRHAPPVLEQGSCRSARGTLCTLCHASRISYADECVVKQRALRRLWERFANGRALRPLATSPQGRDYRVVSKRKVEQHREGFSMGLIDVQAREVLPVRRCAIETPLHALLYERIEILLRHRAAAPLVGVLRYVVLKGDARQVAVLFTIAELSPRTIKAANTLSKLLTRDHPEVQGVFLYEDSSGDRYYMGRGTASRPAQLRRLFGQRELSAQVDALRFVYDVLAFTQVNLSVLPVFLGSVRTLLREARGEQPGARGTLYDLYSGYGLFSIGLHEDFLAVRGAELSQPAVASAISNAKRMQLRHLRFHTLDLNADAVFRFIPFCGADDVVLLDPPRGGCDEGVLAAVAARNPAHVLHVFCNLDLLERDLNEWKQLGYDVRAAVPVDNFPGTDHVEMLVLLAPHTRSRGE